MSVVSVPLRFQIGARTLAAIPRRLVRVALTLEAALSGASPALPPLALAADGYVITSLPEQVDVPAGGFIFWERQRYTRWFVDLSAGEKVWEAGLSGQTRSGAKRKAKKLTQESGGALDIRRYRTPDELMAFHPLARQISRMTYQERLMHAGLPEDGAFLRDMVELARQDRARAWLLFVRGEPVAYLWCSAEGATLRYDHVGHDPTFQALSPGSVLMTTALRDLFGDRFARFDFTEGGGQHKRVFASGGVACRDLLLLRRTAINRMAVSAIAGFDAAMRQAKRWSDTPMLKDVARRVRRA